VVRVSGHYFSPDPGSRLEYGLIETVLRGRRHRFLTASGVFSAKKVDNGTRLLVETVTIPREGRLLDVGCGIGVIGLVAAVESPSLEVTLIDVNPRATMVAARNVERMRLGNVRVLTGSLYEPVAGMEFDVVVSNPPISAGMRKVVEPLVRGAHAHLAVGGCLVVVVQSNKGGRAVAGFLDECFGGHEVLERRSGYRVLSACRR
jgi:16S rRNA (guanine1207-N2)-methyltransferase